MTLAKYAAAFEQMTNLPNPSLTGWGGAPVTPVGERAVLRKPEYCRRRTFGLHRAASS